MGNNENVAPPASNTLKRSLESVLAKECVAEKKKMCGEIDTSLPLTAVAPPTKRARFWNWLSSPIRFFSRSPTLYKVGDEVEVNWVEDDCDGENWLAASVIGFDKEGDLKIKWEEDGSEDSCPLKLVRAK